jgi:formylglycine-generating enzyme required for sulfatase activity
MKPEPRTTLDDPLEETLSSPNEALLATLEFARYANPPAEFVVDLISAARCRVVLDVHTERPDVPPNFMIQRLDSLTGRARKAESAFPTRESDSRWIIDVAPGAMHFWIVQPDVGFAELVRDLREVGREYRWDVWIRPDADARRNMVRVTGTVYPHEIVVQKAPPAEGMERLRLPYALDDYHLDSFPATNREWEEFARATGATRPAFWPKELTPEWLERPVTFISIEDARAYCEWRGKRLPTLPELGLAFRGVEHRTLPPGIDKDTLDGLQVGRPKRKSAVDATAEQVLEDMRVWYLANVLPVGTSAARVGELRDVLGNVSEWADTWLIDRPDGNFRPIHDLRYITGARADREIDVVRRAGFGIEIQVPTEWGQENNGFRCARSARPPNPN